MNDVEEYNRARDRFTIGNVVTSLDDDPEQAGHAMKLGRATGTDPNVVYADVENFDRNLRTGLVHSVVSRDRWLRDYADSHSLAAKVSNDDWAEMSDLSQKITKMSPSIPGREAGLSILMKMTNAFHEGLDLERALGKDVVKDRPEDLDFQKNYPLIHRELKGIVGAGAEIYDLIARPIKGATLAVGAGVSEALRQAGASESTAAGWGREFMGIMEYQLQQTPKGRTRWESPTTVGVPKFGEAIKQFAGPVITPEFARDLGQAYKVAEPYMKVGLEPPVGIHPIWDRFKEAQAKIDAMNLDEVITAADKTKTKERAPDLLANGIRLRQAGNISISGEAVAKLYPEGKVPAADDGILGWVPDLAAQLERAKTGGDIDIPIADFIAKVDKAVHKELRDDIRSRGGGLTISEAKALNEWRQEYQKKVEEEKARVKEQAEVIEPAEAPTEDWMLTQNRLRIRELMDKLEQAQTLEEVNRIRVEVQARQQGVISPAEAFDVYHGTPHFFDVFQMEKIGTGEGAQTYGHGLYFGQAQGTAETYRTAGVSATYVGGRPYSPNDPVHIAAQMQDTYGTESAISMLDEARRDARYRLDAEGEDLYRRAKSLLADKIKLPEVTLTEGNLLKTRIHAELEQFIDLDRKLSEQPSINIEAINQASGMGQPALPDMTGQEVYRVLSQVHGPKGASEILKQAGIPGSRYLDQLSRGQRDLDRRAWQNALKTALENKDEAGIAEARQALKELEPTYNIVLFDPTLAQIIERNGQVLDNVRSQAALRHPFGWDTVGAAEEQRPPAAFGLKTIQTFDTVVGSREEGFKQATVTSVGSTLIRDAFLEQGLNVVTGPLAQYWREMGRVLSEKVGDTPIHIVSDAEFARIKPRQADAGGFYDPNNNLIVLRESSYRSPSLPYFLMHESVHAATLREMHAGKGRVENINRLMTELLKIDPTLAKEYGFKNAFEFVTETFSNPILRERFEKIQISKEFGEQLGLRRPFGTVMDYIRRLIWEMLGKPQEIPLSALDAAIQVSWKPIEAKLSPTEAVKGRQMAALLPRAEAPGKVADAVMRDVDVLQKQLDSLEGAAKAEQQRAKTITDEGAAMDVWQPATEQRGKLRIVDSLLNDAKDALEIVAEYKASGKPELIARIPEFQRVANERIEAAKERMGVEPTAEAPAKAPGEKPIFEQPKVIGLTKERQRLYDRLMAQQRAEDAAWQLSWFEKNERRSQTKEWKENEKKVRDEVYVDLQARPDFAALDYLINGKLYGQRTGRIALEAASLTEEQIAMLPKGVVAKIGAKADDVAAMFGYPDGASMIDHISQLRQKGLTTKDYLDTIIKQETDRVMKDRYGDLEANIIREAQEHVLFSDAQMDMLHQQTMQYGLQAGTSITFTAADVAKMINTEFKGRKVANISVDSLLNLSGKYGRNAELALLKGDYITAYQEKQAQYFAYAMAKEAKKFEKEQDKLGKVFKKYRHRQLPAVDQEFTNFIHDLMDRAGVPEQRRTRDDIRTTIAEDGNTSLEAFADKVANTTPYELHVTPEIMLGQFGKIDDMTVAEWREFRDAITSLDHVGRKMKVIEIQGKELTFQEWKKEVIANIETRAIIPEEEQSKGLFSRLRWDAELVRMEEVFKDLDLRQKVGPMFRAIIMPLIEAKHDKYKLEENLSKRLGEMKGHDKKWQRTLNDTIPNDFFVNPVDGIPFDMTRGWMINIMLNWGNASNREKFVRGWSKTTEDANKLDAQLDAMIKKYANKDDWDFVQQVGDIFEDWRKQANVVYRNISGISPKWVEITPVDTPHGQYRGWYFPLIHSKYHSGINVIKEKQTLGQLFGPNYYRATTANRYIRERTGSVQPIEFKNSIDLVASRMQQTMHDIAYRQQVGQVAKILYDKEIRAAIRQRYGGEYEAQLIPWLQDIANYHNFDEAKLSFGNEWLRRGRMNLMVHALGLNLKVILSPDVGMFNLKDLAHLAWNSEKDVALAWEKSQEIPHTYRNIDRDFRERLEANARQLKADSFSTEAAKWGFLPLVKASQAFRIATFVGEYKRMKMKGMPEAYAVAQADSLVRQRHGATGITDLPAVMRGSEGWKTMTMFYGFFNAMYNWQREIPGNIKRGEYLQAVSNTWGSWVIPAAFGAALFNKAKEDEPLWKTWLKAFGLHGASMLPFARDAAGMMIEGHRPTSPLASLWQAFNSVGVDVKNAWQGKKIKKPVQHAANLIGLATPLPMAQIGRTAQFYHDVYRREQRPKNVMEWIRGTIHGEAKLKK